MLYNYVYLTESTDDAYDHRSHSTMGAFERGPERDWSSDHDQLQIG